MAEDGPMRADTRVRAWFGEQLRKLFGLLPVAAWVVAAVAVAMIAIGLVAADGTSGGIWFELARTGLGVLAVAILGGAAAASFRSREARRESLRRRDEYRAAFVSELWDAYHRIKAVRRALRAAGFGAPQGELSAKQALDFHAQMDILDDAQLALEKLVRTVRRERDVFDPYDKRLLFLLSTAENYVKDVLADWEKHGREVRGRSDFAEAMTDFENLQSFLGRARKAGGIKRRVSVAVERASDLVYALQSGNTSHPCDPKTDCDLRRTGGELPEDIARHADEPDCKQAAAGAAAGSSGGAEDAPAAGGPSAQTRARVDTGAGRRQ